MLEDRGGDQPQPAHALGGCLITNLLQKAQPEDQITEAMVLLQGRPSCSPVDALEMRGSPITGQETLSLA